MRPSLRKALQNFWASERGFAERVRLTVKNNTIKVRTGKDCCGNHGEPGC